MYGATHARSGDRRRLGRWMQWLHHLQLYGLYILLIGGALELPSALNTHGGFRRRAQGAFSLAPRPLRFMFARPFVQEDGLGTVWLHNEATRAG
jgi:hypothetical protein